MTPRFAGKRCLVAGQGTLADAVAARIAAEGGAVARFDSEPELERVDVLVTAFASREDRHFLDLDDELWQRMLDENLESAFLVTRDVARRMAAGGVVVHVGSSVAARPGRVRRRNGGRAPALRGDSSGSRHRRIRVCRVAAPEDGGSGPGVEDVAAAVAFCASDEASYALGSTFFLDGPLPGRS